LNDQEKRTRSKIIDSVWGMRYNTILKLHTRKENRREKTGSSYKIKKGLSISKPPFTFLPVNLLFSHLNILLNITKGLMIRK